MNHRPLGNAELDVSEIGFGCARLGGVFGQATTAEMLRTLRRAFDLGINFFDTADMYTQGESEALLGRAFRADRDKVVIASKAGYRLPRQRRAAARIKPLLRPLVRRLGVRPSRLPNELRGSLTQDFSSDYLLEAVEGSLRRLRTDYLDLLQLHSPPASILSSGDFLEPLERMKAQGKIRYYGVSCETAEDALICLRYPQISTLQLRINVLEQSALDPAVPRAAESGVGVIARECYAGGILAKPDNRRCDRSSLRDEVQREELLHFRRAAEQMHIPLARLALQFVLGVPGVSTVLVGMRTEAHLSETIGHLAAPPLADEPLRLLRRAASSDTICDD